MTAREVPLPEKRVATLDGEGCTSRFGLVARRALTTSAIRGDEAG